MVQACNANSGITETGGSLELSLAHLLSSRPGTHVVEKENQFPQVSLQLVTCVSLPQNN